MTSAQQQLISAIYQAALELPAAERAAFVAVRTAGDPELRSSVERLLTQRDATDLGAAGSPAENAPELAAGAMVAHYRIDAVLGRGGMGVVYRATDVRLNRSVAIKFLSAVRADAQAQRRFAQEAQTASSLNHPHIVAVHDVGEHDGRQYIVSELVDGGTLDDWLGAVRARPWRQSVELLVGPADAVAAAHTAGVIHRDIKPGNILLDGNGYAKLADFGLAKLFERDASARPRSQLATGAGTVLGTVAYMSPEQAAGRPLDARSDIFSFGIVLYEALAGRRPFEADNDLELLKTIVHGAPAALPADVPEQLRNAVERALEKDPADRYQSMRELVIELKRAARKAASGAQSGSSTATALPRTPRRVWPWIAGGVLSLPVALAAWWVLRSAPDEPLARFAPGAYQIDQLTSSGNASGPAISPDGRYVAYTQLDGASFGASSIWVRQVSPASNVRIVAPEPNVLHLYVTVSPDGSYVDYLRVDIRESPPISLWRVPFLGGTPRRIVDDLESPIGWSPDGRQMAFVRGGASDFSTTLVVADADGGAERVLATRAVPQFFITTGFPGPPAVRPAWSPDGRSIALFDIDSETSVGAVFVDVATGRETRLASGGAFVPHGLAWLDARSLVLSQPELNGIRVQLMRMSYPDGAVSPLTNDLTSYLGVDVDRERTSLVTSRREAGGSLWIGDAAGESGAIVVPPAPIGGLQPSISWVGDRVLYLATASGPPALLSIGAEGGAPREALPNALYGVGTANGTFVFMTAGSAQLWKTDGSGRPAVLLTPGTGFLPLLTPDDRAVVFLSTRSGVQAPWLVPIEGGEAQQIANVTASAGSLDISPDGGRILFVSNGNAGPIAIVCDLPACANRLDLELTDRSPRAGPPRFAPDGRSIAYVDATGGNLWTLPLDGSARRQLTHFAVRTDNAAIGAFAWSRDGRRLAILHTTQTDDIVLLRAAAR